MRKRWWIAVMVLCIAILCTGFFVDRSHPDELAPLRPYIVSERIHIMDPTTAPGGTAAIPAVVWRSVLIRGISENDFVGLMNDSLKRDTKWHPAEVKRYGIWQYLAHQGPNFNALGDRTLQAYIYLPKGEKPHVRTTAEFRRSTIVLTQSWPASKWEFWWWKIRKWRS